MAAKTYEQQVKDLEAQIAKLNARKKAMASKHNSDERKARNHAVFVLGGMLLECFGEDGWKAVDWEALQNVIANNKEVIAGKRAEVLATSDATKRLRAWEKARRAGEA